MFTCTYFSVTVLTCVTIKLNTASTAWIVLLSKLIVCIQAAAAATWRLAALRRVCQDAPGEV